MSLKRHIEGEWCSALISRRLQMKRMQWVIAFSIVCAFVIACSGRHDQQSSSRGIGASSSAPQTTGRGQTLTIKGSDTMVILAQRWAEGFMKAHPGTTLQVSG